MNTRKFSTFLIFVAVFGLIGSFIYYYSGITGFPSENAAASEFRMARVNSGGWGYNSRADAGTLEIEKLKEARVESGTVGQLIFLAVGVIGLGLRFASKSLVDEKLLEVEQSKSLENSDKYQKQSTSLSVAEQLSEISRLKEAGHINSDEFAIAKARILAL